MMIVRHSGISRPLGRGRRPSSRQRGFTLIEVLVASVVVGVCLAGIVSMWSFAFTLGAKSTSKTTGYSIGRRALEEVKQTGFQDTTEGTTTVYYDSSGGSKSTALASNHAFTVTTVVSTDVMNGSVPASSALRTVTVTVTQRSTGTTVFTSSTYLARAGI
jgi:prepilin-type N-terminal cleavage/methylation domain-containing protein